MNEDNLHSWIEPELEARIVALVVGEASDFEREELERLIGEQAELGLFRDRMTALHGMLGHIATGEPETGDEEWKLAPERREAVLEMLEKPRESLEKPRGEDTPEPERRKETAIVLLKLASVVLILAAIGGLVFPASVGSLRMPAADSAAVDLAANDRSVAPATSWYDSPSEAAVNSNSSVALTKGRVADSIEDAESELREVQIALQQGNFDLPEDGFAMIEHGGRMGGGGGGAISNPGSIAPGAGGDAQVNVTAGGNLAPDSSGSFGFPMVESEENGRAARSRRTSESLQRGSDFADTEPNSPAPAPAGPLKQEQTQYFSRIESRSAGTVVESAPAQIALTMPEITAVGQGIDNDVSGNTLVFVEEGKPVTRYSYEQLGEGGYDQSRGLEIRNTARKDGETDSQSKLKGRRFVSGGMDGAERDLRESDDIAFLSLEKQTNQRSNANRPAPTAAPFAPDLAGDEMDSAPASDPFDDAPATEAKTQLTRKKEDMATVYGVVPQVVGGGERLGNQSTIVESDKDVDEESVLSPAEELSESRVMKRKESSDLEAPSDQLVRAPAAKTPAPPAQPVESADSDFVSPNPGMKFRARAGKALAALQKNNEAAKELPRLAEARTAAPISLETRGQTATPRSGSQPIRGETIDELIREAAAGEKANRSPGRSPAAFGIAGVFSEPQILTREKQLRRKAAPNLSEISASDEPFSTFSLHVSDVSFKLAQASLAKGEWPEAERIRIEEFVNAFDYGDPMPTTEEKVTCNLEQAIHPFLQQRNLLRVSMRTAAVGRNASTPLRLTLLLDNSGSMERMDRQETVRRAFALLANQLQPNDQVTLISFARQPRLLADRISGDQANRLVQTIANLPSEGGTNLEAALELAFEKAKENRQEGAQNRIILLTDGAANLGDAQPESLSRKIETMRDAGIAFDAAGIGTEGLNDEILEALTRKGDGRYYLLDQPGDADAGFARQIAGALRPAAGNVKVQIEFNPDRVGSYKLLGFEKHRLKKEDFRDDKVDAAEMAAEEAGVAVYQFEPAPDGSGDIGFASVRFRDMATGEMVEKRWVIPYQPDALRPDQASPSLRVATVASQFAARLKGEPLGDVVELDELSLLVSELPSSWLAKKRVVELRTMIEKARELEGR